RLRRAVAAAPRRRRGPRRREAQGQRARGQSLGVYGMTIFEAVESGELDKVKERIAAGDDPNALGKDGITPLMLAAERGYDPIVEALLYAGAEATLTDRIGETALMKAAANAHRAVFR